MRRSAQRIKGLGFILWHTRHHFYHILIGVSWAWFLREMWHVFQPRWVLLSIVASELPDIDHLVYFYVYGRKDQYSRVVKQLFASRQWRLLSLTLDQGHKYNTSLATHNYFTIIVLLFLSVVSYFYEWQSAVVFFGAMVLHYVFDIIDDFLILGYVNPNWRRIKKIKSSV